MITKEDMRGYLDNMLKFEMGAENNYKELMQEVKDKRIRKELARLASDERKHVQMAIKTRQFFEED